MGTVEVAGWSTPPDDDVVRALTGTVVSAFAPELLGPGPTPFFELFRFARVIAVDSIPSGGDDATPCPRCQQSARHRIGVEWETGYTSPGGTVACENCVNGVVTAGAELIPFGDVDTSSIAFEVTFGSDLRSLRESE